MAKTSSTLIAQELIQTLAVEVSHENMSQEAATRILRSVLGEVLALDDWDVYVAAEIFIGWHHLPWVVQVFLELELIEPGQAYLPFTAGERS